MIRDLIEFPCNGHHPAVGLVVPSFDKGGLEQVVLNIYLGLKRRGIRAVILVENGVAGHLSRGLPSEDVVSVKFDEALFISTCINRNIRSLHYHYSLFGLEWANSFGIHTVYILHNVYTWLDEPAFASRARIIYKADKIVAVSHFVAEYFQIRARLPCGKVNIIPNGTNVDALTTMNMPGKIIRTELGIGQEKFVFSCIASSHRNKHQFCLIGAAEILAESFGDFLVLFVGNIGDDVYHNELVERVAASSARDKFLLVKYISHERLSEVYRELSDVVVLPSLQEGCSNVVLEALATGTPLIATDVGNARDAKRLASNVILIPTAYNSVLELTNNIITDLSRDTQPGNVLALVEAMKSVLAVGRHAGRVEPSPKTLVEIRLSTMIKSYLAILPSEFSVDDLGRELIN